MAITSLVIGCLSPFSCAVFGIGSIVGIVLGIVATVKAQRYPTQYGGKTMAIFGIALNGFSIVIVIPIMMAIAIPNLLLSRMNANEAFAISTLRSIGTAEATYQNSHRGFGSFDQLTEAGLLGMSIQIRSGYRFDVKATETRQRWGSEYRFEAFATPVAYGSSGRRSFYLCQDFVIRGADKSGKPASNADPPIDGSSLHADTQAETQGQGSIAGNEASAVRSLRTIATAETTYQATVPSGRSFGSLDDLVRSGLMARGTDARDGYRFEVRATESRENGSTVPRFEVFATPSVYNSTGRRSYYTCEDFVIRGADKSGGQASSADPPINQ
jgi:hypothetical protein